MNFVFVLTDEQIEALAVLVAERLKGMRQTADGTAPLSEWLDVKEAALYLGVKPERVRKLRARGVLPSYQEAPGCRVFFRRGELDAVMTRWQAL